MPKMPTKTALMRSPRTGADEPICKSNEGTIAIITICQCPDCTNCETVEYFGIDFDELTAIIDGLDNTCGNWAWGGDETDEATNDDYNNCTYDGDGKGLGQVFSCTNVLLATLDQPTIPYIDWLNALAGFSGGPHYWTGSWTSNSTGQTVPTNGNTCP